MKPCERLKSTSIAKKQLVALSGLALVGFLFTHLAGNFLMLKGAEAFDHYAEFLAHHPLIIPAEIGLAAVFLFRIPVGWETLPLIAGLSVAVQAQVFSLDLPTYTLNPGWNTQFSVNGNFQGGNTILNDISWGIREDYVTTGNRTSIEINYEYGTQGGSMYADNGLILLRNLHDGRGPYDSGLRTHSSHCHPRCRLPRLRLLVPVGVGRHGGGTSGGRDGQAGLAAEPGGYVLALGAGSGRQRLVSDAAPIPPGRGGRLGRARCARGFILGLLVRELDDELRVDRRR